VVFGEEAAYGLAVDLARGEVDEAPVVLGAVLGLHARKASASAGVVPVNNKAERMDEQREVRTNEPLGVRR
jgi:hypothetical protein